MRQLINPKTKCAEGLNELAPMLTTDDKKAAAQNLMVHYNTVNNYLAGRIADIEIGLQLLEFFNDRVNARLNRVRKILAA